MSKLLIETNDGVRTLIFNRPETKNAFDAELWSLFRDELNIASDDSSISSVIGYRQLKYFFIRRRSKQHDGRRRK